MNKAATVHTTQEVGWSEFARLVHEALRNAQRDGVTEHSLTKYGVRHMELDLRELADLVGAAVPDAEGREVDEATLPAERAAEQARDHAREGFVREVFPHEGDRS